MLNPIKTTDFEAIKLKLASPEDILSWSHGEVLKPETINYRTQKPEKDGLFCEKIFGPSKDWECYCGKYKKIRYKGIVCDKCGVEVTRSIVRRIRMGHIRLQSPVSHIWFLRGLSSKLGIVLDLSMLALEKVIYFASFVVTDVNEQLRQDTISQIKDEYKSKKLQIENDFKKQAGEVRSRQGKSDDGKNNPASSKELESLQKAKDEKLSDLAEVFEKAIKELKDLKPMAIISESAYQDLSLKYGHIFEAGIGAEAIRKLLEKIDLGKSIKELEEELVGAVESKKEKMIKRLKTFKSFHHNNIRPEWMIMSIVPVIPPDLRPMVALDGGRFATSDLNDLYRRVINRNNRLKQLLELNAPEVICRNEKRMLQEAVDALIDNSARHTKTVTASTGQKRNLKSLADSLKGKQGRFRQNLLGKRVDYSGRSVIVVNPKLRLYECGLPKVMALELFKPFVISKLIEMGLVHNVRSASRYIEAGHNEVWDILENITKESYVLLNRAPTLHRLGIQAFRPILIEGKAIQIHPLVCSAFNADFDGDQMAVHVPLTEEAIAEARDLMLSSHNLLKPATGDPIVAPSQDMVWGAFYLTNLADEKKPSGAVEKNGEKGMKYFSGAEEAKLAYELGHVKLNHSVKVKIGKEMVETSVGRIIFNEVLPEKLRYVNEVADKGMLKKLIRKSLLHYSEEETVDFLDNLKTASFFYITKSGLSWGIGDLPALPERDKLVGDAEKQVDIIQEQYEEGLLTDSERYSKIIELWTGVKDRVTEICKASLPVDGPIYSMIESGARGSWAQLTQILGMKGLVTSPTGDIIELPVKGNFKTGFEVLEYFISTHGVRKGLSDTALRTANAGYLTRRLIDVAQDVIITKDDCGDEEGILITLTESEEMNVPLSRRLIGRVMAKDLKNAKGKVLVKAGELISEKIAEELSKENINEASVRSVLSCHLNRGVCAKCYGFDLGYNKLVEMGTAVGIIAAQSIGEPGTQLTMRTFHTGGVAGLEDITQGLPRVEEIFEARPPKRKAYMADVSGRVEIEMAERIIEDERGKMVVNNSQSKILKVYYEGTDSDKYYFAEAIKDAQLASEKSDKKDGLAVKTKKVKALKPNILVADGDEVKANDTLFTIGAKEIKAKKEGLVQVDKKCVKVKVSAEKVKEFIIPKGFAVWVKDGDLVNKGDQLTEGSLDLQQLYRLKGKFEAQKNIIKEIQFVYSSQGQPLNEKHIEIIAKQMFSRIYVQDAGGTDLLSGEIVEKAVFERANIEAKSKKLKESEGETLLLGITKSSLTTNSFLSAASFQNTSSVLIEAAINGKIDYLEGLKENVIIGRLIPSGTGFNPNKKFQQI
ncbi:MAG: DNA-directed RNA polymerase subunit beta' [Patescibacteria group bacterium]|jgi:DNA-directed RNA polymerase subunit beta'